MIEFRRDMVVVFVAVMLFAPPMWMLMDRDPAYTFESVTVEPQEVRAGQDITVTFVVKPRRLSSCSPGVVYRELKEENGKLHVFDPIPRQSFPEITDNTFHRKIRLPENLAPGKTSYRSKVCYSCNPLHSLLRWPVCVPTPEAPFTVVK